MTQQYECPVCDASFGQEGSLKGHITRSTDADHKGLSGPAVVEGEQSVDDTKANRGDGTDDSTPDTTDTGDTNPTMGSADPQSNDSGASGNEELPCGHEAFDPADAPDTPFMVECETCGTRYEVTD